MLLAAVRSVIFNILFLIWTLFCGFIFFPVLFFPPITITRIASRTWTKGAIWLVEWVCGIHIKRIGYESLPPGPKIFAMKHQSALETLVPFAFLPCPVFILKKELLSLPIVGFYLRRAGMIAINRGKGLEAIKHILRSAEKAIEQGRDVFIFPEGTRVLPGKKRRYLPGVAALYTHKAIGAPVVPVALNTGIVWKKNAFIKKPGTVTIQFLPPIPEGLSREEFMRVLEDTIENASNRLL